MSAHAKPTKDEVIALEKSFWDAMKQKDGDRAAELTGKASLVTGSKGVMRLAKAEMGKMTASSDWKLESYTFDDIEVAFRPRMSRLSPTRSPKRWRWTASGRI